MDVKSIAGVPQQGAVGTITLSNKTSRTIMILSLREFNVDTNKPLVAFLEPADGKCDPALIVPDQPGMAVNLYSIRHMDLEKTGWKGITSISLEFVEDILSRHCAVFGR